LTYLCNERHGDALTLYDAGRFHGAFYLLGYVIEIAIKKRICMTLQWEGYPNSRKAFENFNSFKTHDLDNLLHLSGVEKKIKKELLWAWSAINKWCPEIRYLPQEKTSQEIDRAIIAVESLLREL
jgi:hypothetical protein